METEAMIIIAVVLIVTAILTINNTPSKKALNLKQKYDETLNGTDRRAALEAGRAYYRSLKDGKDLTVYDEQAIANDLNTMRKSVGRKTTKNQS